VWWRALTGSDETLGMTRFLSARQIQIFDYPRFAEPLRDRVRERAAESDFLEILVQRYLV
jgi:hypothetical protein